MGLPQLPLNPIASIITNQDGESPTAQYIPSPKTPYQDLEENSKYYEGDKNITYYQLNMTRLSPIQAQLNSYQGENEEEAISYCEDKIRANELFNGSLVTIDKGCKFIAHCTYNRNRYPALLVTGKCSRSPQYCGNPFGVCRYLIQFVQTLIYSPNTVTYYNRMRKHYWTTGLEIIGYICFCDETIIQSP